MARSWRSVARAGRSRRRRRASITCSPARIRCPARNCDAVGSVAGFDVTFSAPKSVSVLFGVGDERMQAAIRDAHRRAVTDAFRYFEDAVSVARRGAGGQRRIDGQGVDCRGVLASHEPRGRSAAAHARRRRQPRSRRRWALVGAGWPARVRARADGRVSVSGGVALGARAQSRSELGAGGERCGRDRGSASAGVACVLASPRPDRGGDGTARVLPGATPRRSPRLTRAARRTATCGPSSSRRSGASARPSSDLTEWHIERLRSAGPCRGAP